MSAVCVKAMKIAQNILSRRLHIMSDWNPEKYLLFKKQRTQPAIDLANRVRDCGYHQRGGGEFQMEFWKRLFWEKRYAFSSRVFWYPVFLFKQLWSMGNSVLSCNAIPWIPNWMGTRYTSPSIFRCVGWETESGIWEWYLNQNKGCLSLYRKRRGDFEIPKIFLCGTQVKVIHRGNKQVESYLVLNRIDDKWNKS